MRKTRNSSAKVVPDNEGRVCDAVVRTLEKWKRVMRSNIRHPEKDGVGPPVDLRIKLADEEYAIEHTRIQCFENQLKTDVVLHRIMRHVSKNIPEPFPGVAYYELQFPTDVALPTGNARKAKALDCLVEWVRTNEKILRQRNAGRIPAAGYAPYRASDSVQGTPDGFECKISLLHWPIAQLIRQRPGTLSYRFIRPDNVEDTLKDRLQQAFSRKCPKLQSCKEEGARTVLALEGVDPDVSHFKFRGELLPSLLAGCENPPDEIFLVETRFDHWWVWLLKRDDGHWPDIGMPELGGFYYDPEQSELPGIPEWLDTIPRNMRDALQHDRMYTPYLSGWVPGFFEKDELDDLTIEPNCLGRPESSEPMESGR